MDFEEVKEAVRKAAPRNELSCHEARKIADDLGVEYSVVGRACNKIGIRMRQCQWAPYCICDPKLDRKERKHD
jgi:hypothetical protein